MYVQSAVPRLGAARPLASRMADCSLLRPVLCPRSTRSSHAVTSVLSKAVVDRGRRGRPC